MIMSDAFSLPLGKLFTTANYTDAFSKMNILNAYKNSIIISGSCSGDGDPAGWHGVFRSGKKRYSFKGDKLHIQYYDCGLMFPVFHDHSSIPLEFGWGIAGSGKTWMSLLSVILPQIAGNMAFAIVVLTGYIRSLPIDLEEAAFMEGCNAYQIFFKVIMPLTKPSFCSCWNLQLPLELQRSFYPAVLPEKQG